ncbi:MAG: hypothetical protein LBG43_09980 [Treponema sp.]|jgi:hypothetical protein|nr:hypothetical protein [Treponema sp.]
MKKCRLMSLFLVFGVIMLFADCAGSADGKAGATISVYDLSCPDAQQCLLIIPRQITVVAIDGDTVQWNWNNSETRVKIPSGSHVLSVKRKKEDVDIMFNFMQGAFYTFNIKSGTVAIIEAAKAQ